MTVANSDLRPPIEITPATALRVGFVCLSFFPDFSGAAQALLRIGQAMKKVGCTVEVICGRPRGRKLNEHLFGLDVVRLPSGNTDFLNHIRPATLIKFGFFSAIYLFLRRRSFDLIVFIGAGRVTVPSVLVCHLAGLPTIDWMTGFGMDGPSSLAKRRFGKLVVSTLGLLDGFVAVSPRLAEDVQRCRSWNRKKLALMPWPLDTNQYKPATAEERRGIRRLYGWTEEEQIFVFVGAVIRRKGVHLLLQAWDSAVRALGPKARFVIVGPRAKDEPDSELWLQAERMPGIELKGRVDPEQVAEILRASDYFLFPSYDEGLPSAVLEAMACGLPSIVSSLDGIHDYLIRDGISGRLVPVGDSKALARAMLEIVDRPDLAKSWGAAARRWAVDNVDPGVLAQRYLTFFEEVLQSKSTLRDPRSVKGGT